MELAPNSLARSNSPTPTLTRQPLALHLLAATALARASRDSVRGLCPLAAGSVPLEHSPRRDSTRGGRKSDPKRAGPSRRWRVASQTASEIMMIEDGRARPIDKWTEMITNGREAAPAPTSRRVCLFVRHATWAQAFTHLGTHQAAAASSPEVGAVAIGRSWGVFVCVCVCVCV